METACVWHGYPGISIRVYTILSSVSFEKCSVKGDSVIRAVPNQKIFTYVSTREP